MTILKHVFNFVSLLLMIGLICLGYPFIGFFIFLLCYGLTMGKNTSSKVYKQTLEEIDTLDGFEFEKVVARLFEGKGYKCKVTQESGDYGADVIAQKGGERVAIQCKRYKGKVGIDSVYQILGGQKYYKTNKAMVVTNSTFTEQAQTLARRSDVLLVDRNELKKLL